MNTRIRYVKQSDGSLISMRVLKARDGSEYRPIISTDGKNGAILCPNDKEKIAFQCTATSPHKVKIKLKNALVSLGVKFVEEKRGSDEDS